MSAPRMWLWRPHMKVHSPVLERNYRCCCSLFNSLCGFKAFNYLMVLFLSFAWPAYLKEVARIEESQWWSLILSTGTTILGSICARTLRPFYMQLYVVYSAITMTMGIIRCSLLLYVVSARNFAYQAAKSHRTLAYKIAYKIDALQIDFLQIDSLREQSPLSIIFLMLALLFFVWQLQLSFSFYF